MADDPNYLTVREAADRLTISPSAVRAAMADGRLPYTETYGRKIIHKDDLEAYRQRTQPGGQKQIGRPKPKATE